MPTLAPALRTPATATLVAHYQRHGYVVATRLFAAATTRQMRDHFMARRAEGAKPGDMGGDPSRLEDPLNRYPRMINMHQWDQPTARWSADPALLALAGACIGQRAMLNQTMLYFKPPGARGQALHQEQRGEEAHRGSDRLRSAGGDGTHVHHGAAQARRFLVS